MKVWAYIDGFNLYNGRLRHTQYKWLNLQEFCNLLLPTDTVEKVKYFTADVNPRPNHPSERIHQLRYLRALGTVGTVEVIYGHFLTKRTLMPTAVSVDRMVRNGRQGKDATTMKLEMVEVYRSEEKGTDVNLAAHLVHDAHLGRFEAALVISNDSDLKESIRIVRQEIGKVVGVFTPHSERPSVELRKTASFFREIKASHLKGSQFPPNLSDDKGAFSKPTGW